MKGWMVPLLKTSSIIIGIALSQQAFTIAIKAMLALVSTFRKESWPNFYSLFCERFELTSAGEIYEGATRINRFSLLLHKPAGDQ